MPSWLNSGDRAYLRNRVRQSKFDPVVEEVEILDVNPQYAHVKLPSGNESTVSIHDLAPCENTGSSPSEGSPATLQESEPNQTEMQPIDSADTPSVGQSTPAVTEEPAPDSGSPQEEGLRRSTRVSKPPARLILEM